jgi:hypothetical protein
MNMAISIDDIQDKEEKHGLAALIEPRKSPIHHGLQSG